MPRITVSSNPDTNWKNDYLQFARLLAEIQSNVDFKITDELKEAMDLNEDEIAEVFDRADVAWQEVKSLT